MSINSSVRIPRSSTVACMVMSIAIASSNGGASEPTVLKLWPAAPPGENLGLPPESDRTRPEDDLIAGRRVIRLGNVSTPQIAVYQPDPQIAGGAAVVICPGGGHYILAYDLEGTEVAEWLCSIGVTAVVLKYRVPARDRSKDWVEAVQDAQRAMSIVRKNAERWGVDSTRIGICGFSAGGETAALTSIFLNERQYDAIDAIDQISSRPDFAMLIYSGGMVDDDDETKLCDHIRVTSRVPPLFMVHAFDDHVSVQNPLRLASEWKRVGVPVELHLYASGGHGYGLRRTDEPVTTWTEPAQRWMRKMSLLSSSASR